MRKTCRLAVGESSFHHGVGGSFLRVRQGPELTRVDAILGVHVAHTSGLGERAVEQLGLTKVHLIECPCGRCGTLQRLDSLGGWLVASLT